MGRKLYVGNLPYSATEQTLREAFSASGTVDSATVITDRDTGQSKGFGFVEMATDAEAQAATQAMNGQTIDGRQIKVNEAKPKTGGGGLRLRIRGHLDEAEALALARIAIRDHSCGVHRAARAKCIAQRLFGGRIRQIADV